MCFDSRRRGLINDLRQLFYIPKRFLFPFWTLNKARHRISRIPDQLFTVGKPIPKPIRQFERNNDRTLYNAYRL